MRSSPDVEIDEKKLVGKVVTKMSLNGGEEDMVDPYITLSDIALKNAFMASPHGIFNWALKNIFNGLPASSFPPADPPTIAVTVASFALGPDGNPVVDYNTEEKYTYPWLGRTTAPDDTDSLSDLCAPINDSAPAPIPVPTLLSAPATSSAFALVKNSTLTKAQLVNSKDTGMNTWTDPGSNDTSADTDADEDLEIDVQDPDNQLYMGRIASLKLALIRIGGFVISNGTKAVIECQQFLQKVQYPAYTDLVVDVRGNTGGDGQPLELFLRMLFPFTCSSGLRMAFKATDFERDYMSGIIHLGAEWAYRYNTTEIVDDVFENPVTRTFTNLDGTTYTQPYTETYVYNALKPEAVPAFIPNYFLFPPEHVYVVTDGDCWSACSIFVKVVKNTRSARLIAMSYNPTVPFGPNNTLPDYQLGSTPGAYLSSTGLSALRKQSSLASVFNNFVNFPPEVNFPAMNVGFSSSEIYNPDPTKADEVLYFSREPYDAIIKEFSSASDATPKGLHHLAQTVHRSYIATPTCFAGEVSYDVVNCHDAAKGTNAVYGHPCVNGTFDENACEFAFCAASYYLTGPKTCSPTPFYVGITEPAAVPDDKPAVDNDDNNKKSPSLSGWMLWTVIGGVVGIVIIVIIIVVVVCVVIHRKKSSYETM